MLFAAFLVAGAGAQPPVTNPVAGTAASAVAAPALAANAEVKPGESGAKEKAEPLVSQKAEILF